MFKQIISEIGQGLNVFVEHVTEVQNEIAEKKNKRKMAKWEVKTAMALSSTILVYILAVSASVEPSTKSNTSVVSSPSTTSVNSKAAATKPVTPKPVTKTIQGGFVNEKLEIVIDARDGEMNTINVMIVPNRDDIGIDDLVFLYSHQGEGVDTSNSQRSLYSFSDHSYDYEIAWQPKDPDYIRLIVKSSNKIISNELLQRFSSKKAKTPEVFSVQKKGISSSHFSSKDWGVALSSNGSGRASHIEITPINNSYLGTKNKVQLHSPIFLDNIVNHVYMWGNSGSPYTVIARWRPTVPNTIHLTVRSRNDGFTFVEERLHLSERQDFLRVQDISKKSKN